MKDIVLKNYVFNQFCILVCSAVFSIIVVSCGMSDGYNTSDGNNTTGDISTIHFSIPSPDNPKTSLRSLEESENLSVFWIESYYRFASDLKNKSINHGDNFINVNKDRIILMGLMTNSTPKAISSRSITSSVSLLGNISVISAGLDTLPLSTDAQNDINLGEINTTLDEQVIESDIPSSEIAESLGLEEETVISYGRFDQVLSKYSNIDIDRNERLDSDDNLEWNIITQMVFPMYSSIYNISTGEFLVDPIGFENSSVEYFFIWENPAEYDSALTGISPSVTLILPPNPTDITSVNGYGTYYISWGEDESEYDDGGSAKYYRIRIDDPSLHLISPLDGNYEVIFSTWGEESWHFFLENIHFLKPANNYDGFIFPIVHFETNEAGIIQNFGWQWKKIQNGQYIDASAEEVRLQVISFLLAFDRNSGSDYETLTFIQRRQDPVTQWYVKTGNNPWYGFKLGLGIYNNGDTEKEKTYIDISYYNTGFIDVSDYNFLFRYEEDSLVVLTEDSAGNFYLFLNSPNARDQ